MRDAQEIKERIRQSVDIVGLIERHVALRPAGKEFKGLCPFHKEKTPSFHVVPAKQIFHCFGCGAGGDIFSFVQRWEKVDFREALRLLAERAGIALGATPGRPATGPTAVDLTKVTQWAKGVFRKWLLEGAAGETARSYITRRGIDDAVAERFGLGFAPDSFGPSGVRESLVGMTRERPDRQKLLVAAGLIKVSQQGGHYDYFRNRVMFPIVDTMDRVVGFGARTLGDDKAKYLNSPQSSLFDKQRILYGINLAREAITARGRAVVVEGYTDCLMAHQFGFPETVATMGTALTPAHVALLRRFTDRVILLFDSDEAGQRASERALEVTLTQQLDVRLACVPEGKDPCDFLLTHGAEAFAAVLHDAEEALRFKWRQVTARHAGAASGRQRREALEEFLDLVAAGVASGSVDAIGRGEVVNQLAKLLAQPPEDVQQELARRTQRQRQRPARSRSHEADSEHGPPAAAIGAPADGAQAALRDLLEVLLNEPGHYEEAASLFRPASFAESRLAAVAQAAVDLIAATGECNLTTLLERFDDPSESALIVELQQRGEQKGAFAERVAGALQTLKRAGHRRDAQDVARQLAGEAVDATSPEVEARLRTLEDRRRKASAFHPTAGVGTRGHAG